MKKPILIFTLLFAASASCQTPHYLPCSGGPPGCNVTAPITMSSLATSQFPVIDMRSQGVVGDGQTLTTCSIAAGSAALTCTGASFSSASVGKLIGVSSAGASAAYLNTTIASVQSATQLTLATAATTTVSSGGSIWYGTDNTAAFCSAVGCNSPTTPNVFGSQEPGRVFILPHGTYLVSGTTYLHNNDNLVNADGQATSELVLVNNTNGIDLLCVSGNASAGSNTCTVDANGTQQNAIEGIMFVTPEASQNCIDAGGSAGGISGFTIHANWFECAIGIAVNGNTGHIWNNTFDSSTVNAIIVKGDGINYGNNPSHSLLIDDNLFFANGFSALQVDGASSVQFRHNIVDFAKDFGVLVNSGTNQNTYRLDIADNQFTTSQDSAFFSATQTHIQFETAVIDSSITGNMFRLSRANDINLEGNISNLTIQGNNFADGQGTSVFVQDTVSGLTISGNTFNNIGNYAVDSSEKATLLNNTCAGPFAVAGLPTNLFDQGCFRFTGATSSGAVAIGNSTTSAAVAAVVMHGFGAGSGLTATTVGNVSASSTWDVVIDQGAGSYISAGERSTNVDPGVVPELINTPISGFTGGAVMYASGGVFQPFPAETVTFSALGAGISAPTCLTTTCTSISGTFAVTVAAGTAAENIVTLGWTALPAKPKCSATQSFGTGGTTTALSVGNNLASTGGVVIFMGQTFTAGGTVTITYGCSPL